MCLVLLISYKQVLCFIEPLENKEIGVLLLAVICVSLFLSLVNAVIIVIKLLLFVFFLCIE